MSKKIAFFSTILIIFSLNGRAQYDYLDNTEFDLADKYRKIDVFQMYEYSDSFGYHIIGLSEKNIYYFDAEENFNTDDNQKYLFRENYRCEFGSFYNGESYFFPWMNDMTLSFSPMVICNVDFNKDGHLDVLLIKVDELQVSINNGNGYFYPPKKILKSRFVNCFYDFHVFSDNIYIAQKCDILKLSFDKSDQISVYKIPKFDIRTKSYVSMGRTDDYLINHVLMMNKDSCLVIYTMSDDKTTKQKTNIKAESYNNKAIDLNNDRLPDLLMFSRNELYVRLNQGNSNFCQKQPIYESNSKNNLYDLSIITEDIDSDNDFDIILYSQFRTIFLNEGSGNFTLTYEDKRDYDMKGISLLDYDLDSDKDIILNSCGGLVLLENINGTFDNETFIKECRYFDFYFFTDINSDKKPDILYKDECSSEIFWCKRTDTGFDQPKNLVVPLSENK